MFWNDPNLYTANLPYRDIGFPPQIPFAGPTFPPQIPFAGSTFPPQIPFAGPTLQAQIPFVGPTQVPWQNIPRFIPPTYGLLPQMDPRMFFANPFVATMPHPWVQPFNVNPALYNLYRPITY